MTVGKKSWFYTWGKKIQSYPGHALSRYEAKNYHPQKGLRPHVQSSVDNNLIKSIEAKEVTFGKSVTTGHYHETVLECLRFIGSCDQ